MKLRLYTLSFMFVTAWENPPNQLPGTECRTPDGLTGNCVTPDSEGHDSKCLGADGFVVLQDGICPSAEVCVWMF